MNGYTNSLEAMCTLWWKSILSFNLLLLILQWNERKRCVHTEGHKGSPVSPSLCQASPHQSYCGGLQGASWACAEPDSLNRTAGMMSTQWQNKQCSQTSLSLTCVIAKAETPGLVLTYTVRLNGSLIDRRSARWPRRSGSVRRRRGMMASLLRLHRLATFRSSSLLSPPPSLLFDAVLLWMCWQLTSLCS